MCGIKYSRKFQDTDGELHIITGITFLQIAAKLLRYFFDSVHQCIPVDKQFFGSVKKRALIVQISRHGAHPFCGLIQIQSVKPDDVRMAGRQKDIRGTVFDYVVNGPGIKIIVMFVRQLFLQGKKVPVCSDIECLLENRTEG